MSNVLNALAREGYVITKDELAALSPYQTRHVKRFGNYEIDLQALPQPITDELLFDIDLDIDLPKDDPLPLLDAPTSTPEAE